MRYKIEGEKIELLKKKNTRMRIKENTKELVKEQNRKYFMPSGGI